MFTAVSPVIPSSSLVVILLLNSFKGFSVSCMYSLSSDRKRTVGKSLHVKIAFYFYGSAIKQLAHSCKLTKLHW